MRIIGQNKQREVFAIKELVGNEFWYFLSPVAKVINGRRPMNMYASEATLYEAANSRNCRVTWLENDDVQPTE